MKWLKEKEVKKFPQGHTIMMGESWTQLFAVLLSKFLTAKI